MKVGEIRAELDALDKSQLDAMEKASSTNYYGGVDEARRRPVSLPPFDWSGFKLLPLYCLAVAAVYVAYERRGGAAERHRADASAWSALDDFCDGFDAALAPPYAACAAHDYETFCAPKKVEDDPSPRAEALRKIFVEPSGACAGACDDPGAGGALPCLWQAVARLPDVCDGSFAFSPPDDLAGAGASSDDRECARRAVCTQCAAGGEFCGAVAERYGDEGRPLFGATAAVRALSDRAEWCPA